MKAVVVTAFGGPEVLELRDLPIPVPQAGEALVKVAAAGINYMDVGNRQRGRPGLEPPFTLGILTTPPSENSVTVRLVPFGVKVNCAKATKGNASNMPRIAANDAFLIKLSSRYLTVPSRKNEGMGDWG